MTVNQSKGATLGLAVTLALAMFGARTWAQIELLSVAMAVTLLYGLSGWATKKSLSIPEKMGRGVALLLVVACLVGIYTWQFRPGWHLTGEQESGLAEVAQKLPHDIVMVVELPENNIAGQEYGKEIMEVFKDNGARVNSVRIFYGVGETPIGLVVSARFKTDPAYNVAGFVHYKMLYLKMPAKFQEGNTWAADASSFLIYVGSRPPD